MDVEQDLIERLDRVVELDRRRRAAAALDGALLDELLDELRALVAEARERGCEPRGEGQPRGEVVERPARRLQGT